MDSLVCTILFLHGLASCLVSDGLSVFKTLVCHGVNVYLKKKKNMYPKRCISVPKEYKRCLRFLLNSGCVFIFRYLGLERRKDSWVFLWNILSFFNKTGVPWQERVRRYWENVQSISSQWTGFRIVITRVVYRVPIH